MKSEITPASWAEGKVDQDLEHMVLNYGSVQDVDEFPPVALVAPAVPGLHDRFVVQHKPVPKWNTDKVERAWEAVRRELDFYLVELEKTNPWKYAIYHCGTFSNFYSEVHWGYYLTQRVSTMPDQRFTHPNLADPTSLLQTEGAGTFWIWAWPELLDWGGEIAWLFAPVFGKRVWPGDLWGVDQRVEFLLVETKRVKKGERCRDPYEDFVDFEYRQAVPDVDAIIKHWLPLCQSQRRFILERQPDLETGDRGEPKKWPGVVDYLLKRMMVWRWRELYLHRMAPRILSGEYETIVRRNLEERVRLGNPPPHYFALFSLFDDSHPKSSAGWQANYARLADLVGKDHIHARAVSALPIIGNQVRIQSLPVSIFDYAP
jgi:hypothetical protein